MKFEALQENLRKELIKRISEGRLTGQHLAEQTGYKQAHDSNFLNRKRGLSLEAMDKVLHMQNISLLDLLDAHEIDKRASVPASNDDEFHSVPLVDAAVAAQPRVMRMHIQEVVKFKKSYLRKLRSRAVGDRGPWERFIALRVNEEEASSMHPRIAPGATLLIDRHYNSLQTYRRGEANLYAVAEAKHCSIRFAELAGKQLVLRPQNPEYGVHLVNLDDEKKAGQHLIGRVCHIGMEA